MTDGFEGNEIMNPGNTSAVARLIEEINRLRLVAPSSAKAAERLQRLRRRLADALSARAAG